MDNMREVLKRNLARSLEALPQADRLVAAWPVACGKAMAESTRVVGFAEGVVEVEVDSPAWLEQMRSMRAVLESELGKIAGVRIAAIHFRAGASTPSLPQARGNHNERRNAGRGSPCRGAGES